MNSEDRLQKSESKKFVLDTSAVLSRRFNLSEGVFLISKGVIDEVALGKISRSLQMNLSSLEIYTPSPDSIMAVKAAAKLTGDIKSLSGTDIELIAISLETGAILVTDDFAIENVANQLGLDFAGADLKKITHRIKWGYRCTGCGKRFSNYMETCPVCGHQLKRFAKNYKPLSNEHK